MKFSFRTPSLHKRIAARTSPALAAFLLAAFFSIPAHTQTASVYGPSGAYMGYVTVTPSMPPGAIPEATAAGMSTGNVKCGDELPKDQYRRFLPAGMEPAPGIGICEGMRRMGK